MHLLDCERYFESMDQCPLSVWGSQAIPILWIVPRVELLTRGRENVKAYCILALVSAGEWIMSREGW